MRNILFLLLLGFISQVYAQWPQWRGPNRDGFSTETNLLKTWPAEGPTLLWSSDKIGKGNASAIIQNKMIYVAGTRDSIDIITAFGLKGNLIWQKEYGKTFSPPPGGWEQQRSTPTFYKNKLYYFTVSGIISCLNSRTGNLDWTINIPGKFKGTSDDAFTESPLIVDDKIILTLCEKNTTLIALNTSTGETIWASEGIDDERRYTSPVLIEVKDKKLIVTSTINYCLAVNLNTGKIVWKEKTTTTPIPLPGNKQIYFSSLENGGKMLNISDDLNCFNYKWCDSLKIKEFGGPVKLGNRIFGTYEMGAGIFCLDWETGKQLAFNKGIRGANLVAADGMIYSYEEKNGRVSLLKPTDNNIEVAGSFKVEGKGPHLAHMSLGNGMLFVRHGEVLMAYNIKRQ